VATDQSYPNFPINNPVTPPEVSSFDTEKTTPSTLDPVDRCEPRSNGDGPSGGIDLGSKVGNKKDNRKGSKPEDNNSTFVGINWPFGNKSTAPDEVIRTITLNGTHCVEIDHMALSVGGEAKFGYDFAENEFVGNLDFDFDFSFFKKTTYIDEKINGKKIKDVTEVQFGAFDAGINLDVLKLNAKTEAELSVIELEKKHEVTDKFGTRGYEVEVDIGQINGNFTADRNGVQDFGGGANIAELRGQGYYQTPFVKGVAGRVEAEVTANVGIAVAKPVKGIVTDDGVGIGAEVQTGAGGGSFRVGAEVVLE
jgi:hypothetical protein